MFCQYKDIFGKPREGTHSTRIPVVDLAAYDVLATLALILCAVYAGYDASIVTAVVIVTFIFAHWLFCVDSKINNALGLSPASANPTSDSATANL